MSKYIKLEDAEEKYRLLIKDYIATESTLIWESAGDCQSAEEEMYREVEQWLKDFESLSTIDIVTCEMCENNKRNTDGVDEDWCLKFGYEIESDDWCSYGERIEE